MANQLSVANVINISVSQPGQGLLPYNTSNLAIFTRDPSSNTVNNILGYGTYLNPSDVANDFGSSSTTSQMANAIFAQQPNILAGGGSLVIIPYLNVAQIAEQEVGFFYAASTTTGTWSTGGTSMVVASSASIAPGQFISGVGLAQGTTVVSVSGTTVNFVPAATTGESAESINFLSGQGVPASGAFELKYGATATPSIAFNASNATIQTDIQTITALAASTVSGTALSGPLVVTFTGVSGAAMPLTVPANTLEDANDIALFPYSTTTIVGSTTETLDQAIIRTQSLVQYFGCMSAEIVSEQIELLAASEIQGLNKLLFVVSNTVADIQPNGMIYILSTGGFTHTRGLYYGDTTTGGTGGTAPINALNFMAAYAGRGLSVNFNGSNTTITMHLKQLATIQPDPTITQTILTLAINAGADSYPSIQGRASVFCTGENDYFDDQYNLGWFTGALQVAGFNALAQAGTKIPQTEQGINVLKNAYQQVAQQGVSNQFLAPGTWTNPVTFGDQTKLIANIATQGYYIFSQPVSQQLPAVRATRAAPLIQIAIQYAGAVQSSSVIVYVNN